MVVAKNLKWQTVTAIPIISDQHQNMTSEELTLHSSFTFVHNIPYAARLVMNKRSKKSKLKVEFVYQDNLIPVILVRQFERVFPDYPVYYLYLDLSRRKF